MNELNEKRHAKILTVFSGILTFLLAIALFACVVFLAISVLGLLSQGDGSDLDKIAAGIVGIFIIPLALAAVLIIVALAIMYLVLGIFLISSAFKHDKVFAERRGFVVTTIVFDFIVIALMILLAFVLPEIMLIFIIVAAVMFVSTVLKMIDLRLHTKRMQKAKIENANATISNTANETPATPATNAPASNNQSEKQDELKKLEEMKAAGLISDKDYEEMKKKALEEN